MKKFLLSLVLTMCILTFVGLNPKASGSFTISTVDGVQVRTESPNGIKFIGKVSGIVSGNNIAYGIVFGKGIQTDLTVNTDLAVKAEVSQTNENGEFYVTMIKFPESLYTMYVTARAYVVVDGVYTYASEHIIRNLYETAKEFKESSNYVEAQLIEDIVSSVNTCTVTYNLNNPDALAAKYNQDRSAMVADFVEDFNVFSGKTVAIDGSDFKDRSWMSNGSSLGYNFLVSEQYSNK